MRHCGSLACLKEQKEETGRKQDGGWNSWPHPSQLRSRACLRDLTQQLKEWVSWLLILKSRCVWSGNSCFHSLEPDRDLSSLVKICPHAGGVPPARTDSGTQPPGKGDEKNQALF